MHIYDNMWVCVWNIYPASRIIIHDTIISVATILIQFRGNSVRRIVNPNIDNSYKIISRGIRQ
jgi:hypothetical protein